jgi:hypothetical protein
MYFFIVEARPIDPPEEDEPGAFVSCWIDFRDIGGAQVLAEHFIRDQGWDPVRIHGDIRSVELADYADDADGRECFAQAGSEGWCFVFDARHRDGDAAGGAAEPSTPPAGNA